LSYLLIAIVVGTITCGVGSVCLAAALAFGPLAKFANHLLSLAAGALLATAMLHLLPEVLEAGLDAHEAFAVLLGGLIFFFLLDKAQLWHHGHEHAFDSTSSSEGHAGHTLGHGHHSHAHAKNDLSVSGQGAARQPGAWAILAGDSVHCFGDGILIASAFMADMRLGVLASLAVLAHEIPHHVGDLIVLRQGASNGSQGSGSTTVAKSIDSGRRAAFVKVAMAGSVTAVGGIAGYFLLDQTRDSVPYFLTLASSSFIYVALADLIPQLQKQLTARQTVAQVFWLLAGVLVVTLMSQFGADH
jgi:zinc and cadmium transporter